MNISIFSRSKNKGTTEKLLMEILEAEPTAKICLLTPNKEKDSFVDIAIQFNNINYISDETLYGYTKVKNFLEENYKQINRKKRSVGWYLQQYLKLAHCYGSKNDLIIIDGDTIFSKNFLKHYLKNPFLIKTKENHQAYQVSNLFQNITNSDSCYIANAGYFSPYILKKYILEIDSWFIEAITKILINNYDFSEYQIMASLIKNEQYILNEKYIKIFRRFELIEGVTWNKALVKYDAISMEQNHNKTLLKKILAKQMYKVGYTW